MESKIKSISEYLNLILGAAEGGDQTALYRISQYAVKALNMVAEQRAATKVTTIPRWVKASSLRIEYGKSYYAKWLDGNVKATGWFQESDGTFFWNVPGYIPITKDEYEHLSILDESAAAVSQDAHEKEIMMQAFDKVRQIFVGRVWIMEGRGSYPYNDDRYQEEVRYMYDEFDQVVKDTWANIKSKSVEYKEWIIAEYLQKDHPAIHDILRRLDYQASPAAGREEDDWIDVNDRLPEEGGRYWCYIKELTDLGWSYFQWNCAYNEREKRFTDSTLIKGEQVTHWRELPAPPKFKQKEDKV